MDNYAQDMPVADLQIIRNSLDSKAFSVERLETAIKEIRKLVLNSYFCIKTIQRDGDYRIKKMFTLTNNLNSAVSQSESETDLFAMMRRYNPPKIEIVKDYKKTKESSKNVLLTPFKKLLKGEPNSSTLKEKQDNKDATALLKPRKRYNELKSSLLFSTDKALNNAARQKANPAYKTSKKIVLASKPNEKKSTLGNNTIKSENSS